MLETELKKLAVSVPALTEAVAKLTEALTGVEGFGTPDVITGSDDLVVDTDTGEILNKDAEPPASTKKEDKPTATKGKGKAKPKKEEEPPQEEPEDDDLGFDDDDEDQPIPVTHDSVKALAKKAIAAGTNRAVIKKAMVKAGAQRFGDLSDDALVKMDKWLRGKL